MAAGVIVLKDKTGKIQRFDWLGYLSIAVLLISLVLGRILFKKIDRAEKEILSDKDIIKE